MIYSKYMANKMEKEFLMEKKFKWTFGKHLILSGIIICISFISELAATKIINLFSLNFKPELMNQAGNINKINNIGIIGGADGPTAIFLSGSVDPLFLAAMLRQIIMLALLLISYIPLFLYLKKAVNNRGQSK